MIETLMQFHDKLFFWLHSFSKGSEELRLWLYIIAERIDMYVVLFGILFIIVHHHKRNGNHPELLSHQSVKEGLFIVMSIGVAWGISYLMKIIFALPRPFLKFSSEVLPLFPYGGFNSFPSGHATLFAALAAGIYLSHKQVGIVFGIMAFLIAVTRVISGVHFPIDILVGWALGAGSVFLIQKYFIARRKKNLGV